MVPTHPAYSVVNSQLSSGSHGDWGAIVSRVAQYAHRSSQKQTDPASQLQQISELLKVQSEISHYQLRVELVSKVSESAVASMRKLQQNQ
jgi:hypothetical protein